MSQSAMKVPYQGGCTCGAIRYECVAGPLAMLNCHSRDCQRFTDSPFSPGVVVPSTAFKLTRGALRYHSVSSAMGGHNNRGFCVERGCPIIGQSDSASQFIGIKASSLDDLSWFRPQMDIFTSEAQPWDFMDPNLPKFTEYPPFQNQNENTRNHQVRN